MIKGISWGKINWEKWQKQSFENMGIRRNDLNGSTSIKVPKELSDEYYHYYPNNHIIFNEKYEEVCEYIRKKLNISDKYCINMYDNTPEKNHVIEIRKR